MTDYLAEWISERPYLIKELETNAALERLLRTCPIVRDREGKKENEWIHLVNQLTQ